KAGEDRNAHQNDGNQTQHHASHLSVHGAPHCAPRSNTRTGAAEFLKYTLVQRGVGIYSCTPLTDKQSLPRTSQWPEIPDGIVGVCESLCFWTFGRPLATDAPRSGSGPCFCSGNFFRASICAFAQCVFASNAMKVSDKYRPKAAEFR